MEVITMETSAYQKLIHSIEELHAVVRNQIDNANKPYLTTKEVMVMLGKSENWVLLHKNDLGSSKSSGTLLFKRKDIDAYIEAGYYKRSTKH